MKSFLEKYQKIIFSLIRICIGLIMIYHGYEVFNDNLLSEYSQWSQFKNYSDPKLLVTIGKATEFISGLLLTFGFYTRIGAFLLMISMLFIVFFIGNGQFWYSDQHPFLLFLFGLLYLFYGSGPLSVDFMLNRKLQ